MRKIFLFLLLVPGLNALSQIDSLRAAFISNHTGFGKPVGEKTNKPIGPEGGTIRSSDGVAELIVPQGALSSSTDISVQPVTNLAFAGVGHAYDCEPSGLQFLKPATLIFHYSDSESKAYDPILQSISWQDQQGEWHGLDKISLDTIAKTVSGNINHFTQFSKKVFFRLDPTSQTVKVGKKGWELLLPGLMPDKYGDLKTNRAEVIINFFDNEKFRWFVNGIENGDATNGTIRFSRRANDYAAYYVAPDIIPPINPVKITVEMDGPITMNDGITIPSVSTSAYITVIGQQYHFTYIHIDENGCYFLVDSSSCILSLDREKATISNIINYKPWSDWPQCDKPCKTTWTNKETIKGVVEITGIASSYVKPADPDGGPPNVNIVFVPAMGNTPSETVTCKDHSFNVPSMPRMADPKTINFDIDGDDVVIHFAGKTSRNELVLTAKNEKTMIYIYKVN